MPPITAAIASIVVRMMLLYGSCACSDQPLVWQCVRSSSDFGFCGLKCFCISFAQRTRLVDARSGGEPQTERR